MSILQKGCQGPVEESPVIVVGEITKIISREESLIAGVGNVWEVQLNPTKILKGTVTSPEIFISFTDVKIATTLLESNKKYLWLLYLYGDSENKYGTKNFTSIYTKEKENEILRIIQNP